MKTQKFLFLASLVLLVLFLLITQIHQLNQTSNPDAPQSLGVSQTALEKHPMGIFDSETFYRGLARAENQSPRADDQITAGIIPHHLFASSIIADFFNRLSYQEVETVILLTPNHQELGDFKVLTSLYGWETPFGLIEPNALIINQLSNQNLVRIDEKTLPSENAVVDIMPFIKFYLPKAKVVPLILSGTLTPQETAILAANLNTHLQEEAVLVAAVDFSHYLVSQQAQERDKITLATMGNFDWQKLFSFNNEYLDSPPSIAVILLTMQKLGKKNFKVLHHINSGELLKNETIETTSYFSIAFY